MGGASLSPGGGGMVPVGAGGPAATPVPTDSVYSTNLRNMLQNDAVHRYV